MGAKLTKGWVCDNEFFVSVWLGCGTYICSDVVLDVL